MQNCAEVLTPKTTLRFKDLTVCLGRGVFILIGIGRAHSLQDSPLPPIQARTRSVKVIGKGEFHAIICSKSDYSTRELRPHFVCRGLLCEVCAVVITAFFPALPFSIKVGMMGLIP